MKLERLRSTDISLGMVLPFDIYDKNNNLLLSRGRIIANRDLLRRNLERGMYAASDELHAARNPTDSQLKAISPAPKFEPTQATAFDLVRGVRSDLDAILEPAPIERGIRSDLAALLLDPALRPQFPQAVLNIASEVQKICQSDGDAAVASIVLDRTARYPIRHSVNTAILTELILRRMEQDIAHRLSTLGAALTMNIAMIRLQEVLYHQAAPLDSEQKVAINAHPFAGVEQLSVRGVTDEVWLKAVAQHHEQLDGKGYPKRLSNVQLAREGQVITVAEKYCSMISERGYRPAMLPNMVLKKLFMQSESLNTSVVELLIREVGIYPPGSYVRLANGEIAIVLKSAAKAHQPLVQPLASAQGEKLTERHAQDTSEPAFQVVAAIAPTEVRVEHDPVRICTSPAGENGVLQ